MAPTDPAEIEAIAVLGFGKQAEQTMRIAISGGTGFVGKALVSRLAGRGDEVSILTRHPRLLPELASLPRIKTILWDPPAPGAWQKELDGFDVILHLAGEQAVGQRWTRAVKDRIFGSRVTSLRHIVEAIERAEKKPRVLISASGVGFYGGTLGGQAFDESAAPGSDFLAEVCVAWEAAAKKAESYGVRVGMARLGVVLGQGGGALDKMTLPFKFFVGGKLASGEQYFSWIHLDDAVNAFLLMIDNEGVRGPVNMVAPEAVPQAELARAMGKVLHRPSWLPAPGFGLKLLFGEGAAPILTGQRAVPKVLEQNGFVWKYPELDPALRDALGVKPG